MNASVMIAAAYLILTYQGSGLSNDTVKIIPYNSMQECELAIKSLDRYTVDPTCIPGSKK